MTVNDARKLAEYLFSLNAVVPTRAANALVDLVDQLEYLLECDTITDSKLQLLREYGESWKEDALLYQAECEDLRAINEELKKQVTLLKLALIDSK